MSDETIVYENSEDMTINATMDDNKPMQSEKYYGNNSLSQIGAKRKLSMNMISNDVRTSFDKKLKLSSPMKRQSSTEQSSPKKNFKSIKGELVAKNTISINNENFYLLKFLVDNKSKEYYCNVSQFNDIKENMTYEVSLTYNKKIFVDSFKECKDNNNGCIIKKYLPLSDFDENETVSIYAQFKHGFKLLDGDIYKMVFYVWCGNTAEEADLKEIECMSTLKKIAEMIKEKSIKTENDLLEYFMQTENSIIILNRVKCQNTNNYYRSWSIQNITQMQVSNDCDLSFDSEGEIMSISRGRKRIEMHKIYKIAADQIGTFDRLAITFQSDMSTDEQLKATYYYNKSKNNNIDAIIADLNQLTDLIENDIVQAYAYVTIDLDSIKYNLLGITKNEIDSNTYSGV